MTAMVRVAGEDGERAVDLLGQDHEGELVREGNCAQRQAKVGAVPGRRRPAVCRTYAGGELLQAAIAEPSKLLRKPF